MEAEELEPQDIVDKILEYRNVDKYLLTTKTRRAEVALIRKLISFFLKKYTTLTLFRISKYAGVTDHSTVSYHIAEINDKISIDKSFQNLIYETDCFIQGKVIDIYSEIKEIIMEYFNMNDFSLNVTKKTRNMQLGQDFLAYFLNKYLCDHTRMLKLTKYKNINIYYARRNMLLLDLKSSERVKQHEYLLNLIIEDLTVKINSDEYRTTQRTNYISMQMV